MQAATAGDTNTLPLKTLTANAVSISVKSLVATRRDGATESGEVPLELVLDKGYHSNDSLVLLKKKSKCGAIAQSRTVGAAIWIGKQEEKAAVYQNRRRIRGERGKRLLRQRGELVERSFAHMYETGGMRRTHLRFHDNYHQKRLLIHAGAFNLSLIMRKLSGYGTPRGLQGRALWPLFYRFRSLLLTIRKNRDLSTLLFRALRGNIKRNRNASSDT